MIKNMNKDNCPKIHLPGGLVLMPITDDIAE